MLKRVGISRDLNKASTPEERITFEGVSSFCDFEGENAGDFHMWQGWIVMEYDYNSIFSMKKRKCDGAALGRLKRNLLSSTFYIFSYLREKYFVYVIR